MGAAKAGCAGGAQVCCVGAAEVSCLVAAVRRHGWGWRFGILRVQKSKRAMSGSAAHDSGFCGAEAPGFFES